MSGSSTDTLPSLPGAISVWLQLSAARIDRVPARVANAKTNAVIRIFLAISRSPSSLGERRLQLALLLVGEVGRNDLEVGRRLEGAHHLVRGHRTEQQEQGGGALRHLAA